MAELTRIERVVFLRGVDLFTYTSAEQLVRIAEIARQERFAPGETIFDRNTPPDALFAVVEGRVTLAGEAGRVRRVGPKETFGVEEILSDRLRGERARAEQETSVLVLEAEDFFDLLSNNIEIVKALFRRLLRPAAEVPEVAPPAAVPAGVRA
ncbi:MAG: cyclic nucleotide-binding domain-containing protein [Acidobacteria bacterium]|nr:MAG: cyclic nucleotide-binding domain-containing protein [Acidobacteriota bacterium]